MLKKRISIVLLVSAGLFSCTSKKTENTGIEYSSKYICPMHCEGSGSDSSGVCPVCGMDYVLNEKSK